MPKLNPEQNPYRWSKDTIAKILTYQDYCGDMINFKRSEVDSLVIFPDRQKPIISREIFAEAQKLRLDRKPVRHDYSEPVLFSDLLLCATAKVECMHNAVTTEQLLILVQKQEKRKVAPRTILMKTNLLIVSKATLTSSLKTKGLL